MENWLTKNPKTYTTEPGKLLHPDFTMNGYAKVFKCNAKQRNKKVFYGNGTLDISENWDKQVVKDNKLARRNNGKFTEAFPDSVSLYYAFKNYSIKDKIGAIMNSVSPLIENLCRSNGPKRLVRIGRYQNMTHKRAQTPFIGPLDIIKDTKAYAFLEKILASKAVCLLCLLIYKNFYYRCLSTRHIFMIDGLWANKLQLFYNKVQRPLSVQSIKISSVGLAFEFPPLLVLSSLLFCGRHCLLLFPVRYDFASERIGLGRYDEDLDHFGDINEMRRIGCLLKSGGFLFLRLPLGFDQISDKCYRIYGSIRLALLIEGFELLDFYHGSNTGRLTKQRRLFNYELNDRKFDYYIMVLRKK
ncbi:hypothetical protein DdX_18586 [Ditylenchus destructor]|uniref:Uncharacterized protein n=1 Tax=Ditylenchus destructor TaxID=166010 RepID=A0AAD4ML96_9BILA|nr:hypothetical protein DdX_18586 [Ditylenchus destructor]